VGLSTLTDKRDENTIKTGKRILTNEKHPTTSQMKNRNIYDDYAMKPRSLKPFLYDGRKMEKTPDYIKPPWYTDDGRHVDWSLCKMRKGTPNKIFRAEF
jgi:hypothetical protein